jgi:3-methylcrotonyl-CoA carboxylase alpha subunit
MGRIQSILIANRGEIAARIARTARDLGIRTIAVYSDADADSPHVRAADTAVRIGAAPSAESYLSVEAILEAARRMGADAIHPGYGFLSENPDFARASADAGILFIGPTAEAMEAMGLKSVAKDIMASAGVPIVPGFNGKNPTDKELIAAAADVGYPLLVKASAGGGGRGMRRVDAKADLAEAIASARRESKAAFGDDTLLLERYIVNPRHIEFQVLGDTHGNVVHLFERECSIQRRHQKIIEETPSPALDQDLRERMGEAAVQAAKSIGYVGAGTVEFILADNGEFHFLEMNTRLQVEHPITECVTGIDLVAEQIRIAEGLPLSFDAASLSTSGAAVECRIYAEDPEKGFLPANGTLLDWHLPALEGIRIDSGVETGSEISIHYDPMLAKIIASGRDREEAHRRMHHALTQLSALGVTTNRGFLLQVLAHPAYQAGDIDTHFIETHFGTDPAPMKTGDAPLNAAIASTLLASAQRDATRILPTMRPGWRNNRFADPTTIWMDGEQAIPIARSEGIGDTWTLRSGDATRSARIVALDGVSVRVEIDGVIHAMRVVSDGETWHIHAAPHAFRLVQAPRFPSTESADLDSGCVAPMPGKVLSIAVAEGDSVERGTAIAILEAMKMEHTVTAPSDGVIASVLVTPGDQVAGGAPLVVFEAA